MQHKIRNDAQQQQHYLGEFADWNATSRKDKSARRPGPAAGARRYESWRAELGC